jgi:DNA (cytosine-5)-methyltransferase 1
MRQTLLLPKRHAARPAPCAGALRAAGLFAGIGGIERGLHLAGHTTELLCEIDAGARAVLEARFPGVPVVDDVQRLTSLPEVGLVCAGFPCQDLSQAGRTVGIDGVQSGLIGEVFRLLADPARSPRWVLLENVPFMLQLQRGRAMQRLAEGLERLGFAWAYRTVDAQAFGLPQRRQRVFILASRSEDPRDVLLVDDAGAPPDVDEGAPCGFYWTEGTRGLGWAVDAVPTLKGGSTVGIPSPPAIWMRHTDGAIVTPDLRDAERLQGFPPDWTLPAGSGRQTRKGGRWKLVGNAVSVPVARWLGECLRSPQPYDDAGDEPLGRATTWPRAGWGRAGKRHAAAVSMWPTRAAYQHLAGFLQFPTAGLSERGAAGFLGRARASGLRFVSGFLDAVAWHLERRKGEAAGL